MNVEKDHGYYQPAAATLAVVCGCPSQQQPSDPSCHSITTRYDLADDAIRHGARRAAGTICAIAATVTIAAATGGNSGCQGSG